MYAAKVCLPYNLISLNLNLCTSNKLQNNKDIKIKELHNVTQGTSPV